MGVYGGIQLPNISEENLDDKKERKQILNYLALLDEKLRYMFQNIDVEENFSEESKGMFLEMGKEFKNLVQDNEGRMSLLIQEVDNITSIVTDPETGMSAISQKADSITSTVANLSGQVSSVKQTADGLESTVSGLNNSVSAIRQKANMIDLLVTDETTSTSIKLTSQMITAITNQVNIEADVNLYGKMVVYEDSDLNFVGGYVGYGRGYDYWNDASTHGILIEDESKSSRVVVHGSGISFETEGGEESGKDYDFGMQLYHYTGNLIPSTDGKQMLGEGDFRWQGVFAKNGTIQTSDRRKKKDIEYDMAKYEEFFSKLKPTQYKMIDGESDRYHIGFISQDVEDTLAECGLESTDFAGFIKTPKRAVRDDANSEILDYHYSLRYDEFVALNTHMIQKLMARVKELENKLEALS